MRTISYILRGALPLFLIMTSPAYSNEPINKHLVEKAPKEEPVPMLQFLTGIAMKKEGMDPKYINPRVKGKP